MDLFNDPGYGQRTLHKLPCRRIKPELKHIIFRGNLKKAFPLPEKSGMGKTEFRCHLVAVDLPVIVVEQIKCRLLDAVCRAFICSGRFPLLQKLLYDLKAHKIQLICHTRYGITPHQLPPAVDKAL